MMSTEFPKSSPFVTLELYSLILVTIIAHFSVSTIFVFQVISCCYFNLDYLVHGYKCKY